MNAILNLSLELRLSGLFVVGLFAGSFINWACYSLAWHPRPISPWSGGLKDAPPRTWSDRIPLFGWIFLRREAPIHGPFFWIRPFLVELVCGFGLAWLYWWEVDQNALLPMLTRAQAKVDPVLIGANHVRFVTHALLFAFLAVASLIDLDERIIPDSVTIPGTLLGLLACLVPLYTLLPVVTVDPQGRILFDFLRTSSPNPLPAWFEGCPEIRSLLLGLGAWWLWIFALMPRTWYSRHGAKRAIVLAWARLRRERITLYLLLLGLLGTGGIFAQWLRGQLGWDGLLTGLVGMIAGALLIWAVRIVGSRSLQSEAMGFGDVILMAMIGVCVGWQSCLVVFFFAVFYAIGFAILHYILRNDKAIPFGPFLCLGTVTLILLWDPIWARFEPIFGLGWLIAAVLVVSVVLMGIMLTGWRMIREAIWGE